MSTKKAPKSDQPESVTMEATYSFYDDEGLHRYWSESHVVTDAADIALLIERGAPLKE